MDAEVEDPSDQEEANRYQVHKAVFDNDLPRLSSLLRINKDGASDKKEVSKSKETQSSLS